MLSFHAARRLVLESVPLQPAVRLPLDEVLGLTLAEAVRSGGDLPPFDNSAMDGFAVRAADLAALPAELEVIEEIRAGSVPRRALEPGRCARIMTGAPVPAGADAVVPVEWTESPAAGRVRILRAPEPGQHLRRAGEDVRAGAVVFEPGRRITPPVVGMLAALGCAEVPVRRAPAVAVIATGDELVPPGETPAFGHIHNSNGPALAAQVRSAGGVPAAPLVARDDVDELRRVFEAARAAEVVLVSGGVSMGTHDLVRRVLDEMGLEERFWQVRQRPGKPLAFGLLDGRPVFGLPGNPVSSSVCFEVYVRPALARMLGRAEPLRPLLPARLAEPIRKAAGLHHFVRGRLEAGADGQPLVRTTGPQGSNLYASMVHADCLIHLPEEMADPPAGALVHVERLEW